MHQFRLFSIMGSPRKAHTISFLALTPHHIFKLSISSSYILFSSRISSVTGGFFFLFITFGSRKRDFFFFSLSCWPFLIPSQFTASWQERTWSYADAIYLCAQSVCERVAVEGALLLIGSFVWHSDRSNHSLEFTWISLLCELKKLTSSCQAHSSEKEIAHLYCWAPWKDLNVRFLRKMWHMRDLQVLDSDTAPHVGHLLHN